MTQCQKREEKKKGKKEKNVRKIYWEDQGNDMKMGRALWARRKDNRWSKRFTAGHPRTVRRGRGRQNKRRGDEIVTRTRQDGVEWQVTEENEQLPKEGFIQKRDTDSLMMMMMMMILISISQIKIHPNFPYHSVCRESILANTHQFTLSTQLQS